MTHPPADSVDPPPAGRSTSGSSSGSSEEGDTTETSALSFSVRSNKSARRPQPTAPTKKGKKLSRPATHVAATAEQLPPHPTSGQQRRSLFSRSAGSNHADFNKPQHAPHTRQPPASRNLVKGRIRRWRSAGDVPAPPSSETTTHTRQSSNGDFHNEALKQTRVFTVRYNNNAQPKNPSSQRHTENSMETPLCSNVSQQQRRRRQDSFFEDDEPPQQQLVEEHNCATAILQHSYLELCGSPEDSTDCFVPASKDEFLGTRTNHAMDSSSRQRQQQRLPDDPTVQESIECVFASQLGENLAQMLQHDDDEEDEEEDEKKEDSGGGASYTVEEAGLVAPSVLQQSLLRNRSDRTVGSSVAAPKPRRKSRKLQESLKLVHVGTHDPNQQTCDTTISSVASDENVNAQANTAARVARGPCACGQTCTPIVDADRWPQRPLLLRPTPKSGTVVKGIRKAHSTEYLWKANHSGDISTLTWPSRLRHEWGQQNVASSPLETMCPQCMILPINNGNEAPGESLVIDFESELFDGTLMVRIRYSEGSTPQPYSDDFGYFHGMNRRYQTVVQGQFKKAIPLTECMTGFIFDRPCGRLPQKWILKSGLKVLSFFAPQLQAQLDGPHPSSLTPLGSTPQVLAVHNTDDEVPNIETKHVEPKQDQHTLLGDASEATATLQRARHRKKQFDKLFAQHSATPTTDPTKVYTFEFLQHLFNFNEFSIELGSMLGSIKLKEIVDGQPMPIAAFHKNTKIWSFDVWHEVLLEDSRVHEDEPQPLCEF